MKDIKNILKNTAVDAQQVDCLEPFVEKEIDIDSAKIINYIFKCLAGIIPAFKYSADSTVQLDSIRREYTFALMDSGIKDLNRIDAAIKKIRMSGIVFLPSPGEFVKYCKITFEEIGSPSPESAYSEACKNANPCIVEKKWSHKAVKHAANMTRSDFLRTAPSSVSRREFMRNYEVSCNLFYEGKILDQITHESDFEVEERFIKKAIVKEEYKALDAKASFIALKNILK